MYSELRALKKFHESFGLKDAEQPTARIDSETFQLRKNLIQEEFEEYQEAVEAGDLVEVCDALADLMYVVFGTVAAHGIEPNLMISIFWEVHDSNMSKLDDDRKPIHRESDGKVLKSDNYFEPDIAGILEVCGIEVEESE